MRLQIPSNSNADFFAVRGSLEPQPANSGGSLPSPTTKDTHEQPPPTPIDPAARLTREINTLRLRLATAERKERQQLESQSDHSPRALPQQPPPSARTPPSATALLSHLSDYASTTTKACTTIIETTTRTTTTTTADTKSTKSTVGNNNSTHPAPIRRRTTSAFTYTSTHVSARPDPPSANERDSVSGASNFPAQVRRSLSRSSTTRTATERHPPPSSQPSRYLKPPSEAGDRSSVHDNYDNSRRSSVSRASTRSRYSDTTSATHTVRAHTVPTIKVTTTPITTSTTSSSRSRTSRDRYPNRDYYEPNSHHDDKYRRKDEMKPAERCKQLEKTLREVQDLLRLRDREIEVLQKERDRILAEREQEKNLEKEREQLRERERALEKERERERGRERSRERERERDREREREKERERERQREKEREQERERERAREREREKERERERERRDRSREREQDRDRQRDHTPERQSRSSQPVRLTRPISTFTELPEAASQPSPAIPNTESTLVRRSKSQAPFTKDIHSNFQTNVPILTVESEQLAQLRSLDVFLTKTDGWSGAQVIQAVEDLNSEITHFAASATESCAFERRPPPKPASATGSGRGRGKGKKNRGGSDGRATPTKIGPTQDMLDSVPWLGPAFAKVLAVRDHAQDPMLVQLALQASLATCCARSLSLFCVGFPSKLDGLLSSVFGQMQSTEPQPTSSRWRSLTHRSIRALYPGLEEYAISELITTMLRWSSSVFVLSGCMSAPQNSSPLSPKPQPGKEPIVPVLQAPMLRAQLRRIAEAVCKLARVTREEILSTSFEVISVESGGLFDEAGMLNAFRDHHELLANGNGHSNGKVNGKGEGGKILCTTELGLKCTTRKGKSITLVDSDADLKEDLFEKRVLLPPKVVLDSAVDALE